MTVPSRWLLPPTRSVHEFFHPMACHHAGGFSSDMMLSSEQVTPSPRGPLWRKFCAAAAASGRIIRAYISWLRIPNLSFSLSFEAFEGTPSDTRLAFSPPVLATRTNMHLTRIAVGAGLALASAISAQSEPQPSNPSTASVTDNYMGPAAFMWPPDRVWSGDMDNQAPCGSRAAAGNRTKFPISTSCHSP